MSACERCGNDYDKSFDLVIDGKSHTFDCFECAIATVAPTCEQCGVKIIGHGLEAQGQFFCCDNCATKAGVEELRDRV